MSMCLFFRSPSSSLLSFPHAHTLPARDARIRRYMHLHSLSLTHTHIHNARLHTSENDAADALQKCDGEKVEAVNWIFDERGQREQKEARGKEDARVAEDLLRRFSEEARELSDQQRNHLQRETEKETGMIGDLGERQTRQKHAKRDSQVLTHSSQPLAKKQRSDGAGGIGGRRLAPSILGDKKLDKHALLQRNVMYKCKCGQVVEAFENNGLCQLEVRFQHDSSLLRFDEKLFVEDVEDPAEFEKSDKVLLLPRYLHCRGSVPRPLSIGESNVFYYEENVVCEVPENSFGPDYEYIRFQIFDPSHTDFWQRMDVEQSMREARLSAETDPAASHDNLPFSLQLKG
jgi:hypothetical protein